MPVGVDGGAAPRRAEGDGGAEAGAEAAEAERAEHSFRALKALDGAAVRTKCELVRAQRCEALAPLPAQPAVARAPEWAAAVWRELQRQEQLLFEPRGPRRPKRQLDDAMERLLLAAADGLRGLRVGASPGGGDGTVAAKRRRALRPEDVLEAERAFDALTLVATSSCTALVPWTPLPQRERSRAVRHAAGSRRARHREKSTPSWGLRSF
jgi:hypothetical protein